MSAPREIDRTLVYVVDESDPDAMSVVRKLCGDGRPKPGQFIPVTAGEYRALRKSVTILVLPP